MIQLKVLSGKKAGTEVVARHFPVHAGRAENCELSLDDAGVWDRHFRIELSSTRDFVLTADARTTVTIDGKSVQQAALRNGDIVEFGSAKILFGFSPTRQKTLAIREWLTWLALGALCAGQIFVIYQMPG